MENERGKSSTGCPEVCDVILGMFRCFCCCDGNRREPTPVIAASSGAAKAQEMDLKNDGAELPLQKHPVDAAKVVQSSIPSEQPESLRTQASDIDIRFSSYIDRAKSRLRSMPSTSGSDGWQHRESPVTHAADERFTDYINRAGRRLRTSSSFGRKK
ncbi:hypothetical protein MLD38_026415 [Melastoma candidum]|uniref:Uncharacterized protein n=1 Tax=Melastoma candidum TaxID=119954 RepID=A0ACB9NYI1_9MYRT|nr:hypothetical protein MLD38_026415 [Melastoma candidum]